MRSFVFLLACLCGAFCNGQDLPGQNHAQLGGDSNRSEVGTAKSDSPVEAGFAGQWVTTFGLLVLQVNGDRVTGSYELGTVKGRLGGGELAFTYQEKNASGVGKFRLSNDGQSFEGQWRQDGAVDWREWDGTRGTLQTQMSGLWRTSFGPLRLSVDDDKAVGVFQTKQGVAWFQGQWNGKQIDFQYDDGPAKGIGWVRPEAGGILVAWKPKATENWIVSKSNRIKTDHSRVWLLVLEANWETRLEERPYSFGSMLKQYFTMATAKHVQVRHRFFHDLADLKRFCREAAFLPGHVVLLVSTHGTPKGITVSGETIKANEFASCLHGASNIRLLHLSGCSMMKGQFAHDVQKFSKGTALSVSGYTNVVGWDASAIADFTYLTMILLKGIAPVRAAEKAIAASPYIGAKQDGSGVFLPLGLRVLPGANSWK